MHWNRSGSVHLYEETLPDLPCVSGLQMLQRLAPHHADGGQHRCPSSLKLVPQVLGDSSVCADVSWMLTFAGMGFCDPQGG